MNNVLTLITLKKTILNVKSFVISKMNFGFVLTKWKTRLNVGFTKLSKINYELFHCSLY